MVRWQDVAKYLTGGVGIIALFSALFLLTGVSYTHSGDIYCDEICESYINVTTKYWRICFDNYNGTKYEAETLFKKQTRSRTLHVNLDHVDNIIQTEPKVEVEWLVPARGKGNWRPIKGGDCWERGKNNRIKLVGHKEKAQNVKWSFILGDKVDIDPEWIGSNYTIDGDKVYINDSKAYIEAYPHTVRGSDWVTFNFTSKVYSGDVDLVLGFDTDSLQAQGVRKYNPTNESRQASYTCNYEFNFSSIPKHAWCYENVSSLNNETNETVYSTRLIFERDFDSGNLSAKTIYWTEDYIDEYKTISNDLFNSIDYDYQGMNKWYYYKNLAITQGEPNAFQVKINNLDPWGAGKKYWFAIKPSGETIQQAIDNGHFYALDPWTSELNDSLVSYWKMDDSSGNLIDVFDSNDCSYTGALYSQAGLIETSIGFDGINDLADCGDAYDVGTGGFAISLWVKGDRLAGLDAAPAGKSDWGAGAFFMVKLVSTDHFGFYATSLTPTLAQGTSTPDDSNWHHVVVSYNGTHGKVYVDGVLESITAMSGDIGVNANSFKIGARNSGSNRWNGTIDEVALFNEALTDGGVAATETAGGQVAELYNSGAGLPFGPPPSADSCTYSSGNWEIECSDNCNISGNVDVLGNNISVNGTGYLHITANITNFLKLSAHGTDSSNICRINCNGGCFK